MGYDNYDKRFLFFFLSNLEFRSWIFLDVIIIVWTSNRIQTIHSVVNTRFETKFEICKTYWITDWRTATGSEEQRSRTRCTHLRMGWARGRPCISIERLYKTYRCVHGPWVPGGINSSTAIRTRLDGGWQNDILVRDNWKTSRRRIIRATRIESPHLNINCSRQGCSQSIESTLRFMTLSRDTCYLELITIIVNRKKEVLSLVDRPES